MMRIFRMRFVFLLLLRNPIFDSVVAVAREKHAHDAAVLTLIFTTTCCFCLRFVRPKRRVPPPPQLRLKRRASKRSRCPFFHEIYP